MQKRVGDPGGCGLAACPPPPGTVAEVTSDDRFTGARLAVASRAELLSWLAEFGVDADAGS